MRKIIVIICLAHLFITINAMRDNNLVTKISDLINTLAHIKKEFVSPEDATLQLFFNFQDKFNNFHNQLTLYTKSLPPTNQSFAQVADLVIQFTEAADKLLVSLEKNATREKLEKMTYQEIAGDYWDIVVALSGAVEALSKTLPDIQNNQEISKSWAKTNITYGGTTTTATMHFLQNIFDPLKEYLNVQTGMGPKKGDKYNRIVVLQNNIQRIMNSKKK